MSKLAPCRKKFSLHHTLDSLNFDQQDLLRLSGILEFCNINIEKYERNRTTKRETHTLKLRINHKNEEIIKWIISRFGGSYTSSNTKYCYRYECIGINAAIVLNAVQKYLISKRKHAVIAIMYASTIVRSGHRKLKPLTDAEIAYRDLLQKNIRELNAQIKTGVDDIKDRILSEQVMIASTSLGLFDFDFDEVGPIVSHKDTGFFDSFITHLSKSKK